MSLGVAWVAGYRGQALGTARTGCPESMGPVLQCSSCPQQFMQKKDLQSHMIKLHGAPKPHAVRARQGRGWAHSHRAFPAGGRGCVCPEVVPAVTSGTQACRTPCPHPGPFA